MDREVITKSKVTVEEERGNGGGISRRTFLKGVGGVAAAAAVLGLSGLKSKALAQSIPVSATLSKKKLLEAYRRMQRIRIGEMRNREMVIAKRYPELRSSGHQSCGEEACCVGVAMAMEKGDLLTGTHRSHGYPLAVGVSPNQWMAELMCKVTGTNKGHGGSMHIAAPELGCLAMSGIVGSGVPHAVGAARAFKLLGKPNVGISTCGDGAMNCSGFNSSLNMAAMWNLPVVFVVHNNQWAIDSKLDRHSSLTQAGKDLSVRASGFAIPGITVDGNDFEAVYKAAKYCIDRARQLKGTSLLELVTYRHWAHSGTSEHEVTKWPYNNPAELEYWLRRDPITRFDRRMVEGGLLTEAELESVRKEVGIEMDEALEYGLKSPLPDPKVELRYFQEVFKV